jgi:hypothetical protein
MRMIHRLVPKKKERRWGRSGQADYVSGAVRRVDGGTIRSVN